MANIGRRGFVKGATAGALAFAVGGVEVIMTAHEARARGVPFRLLDGHQGETLEALGETLVPQALRRSTLPSRAISSALCGVLSHRNRRDRCRQQQDVRP